VEAVAFPEVFSAASGMNAVEGGWRAAEFAAGEAPDRALEVIVAAWTSTIVARCPWR
jgi:hypothetical protein